MHKRPVGGTFSSGGELFFFSVSTRREVDVEVEVDVEALNVALTSLSTSDPLQIICQSLYLYWCL